MKQILVWNIVDNRGLKFDDKIQLNQFAKDVLHLTGVDIKNSEDYHVENLNAENERVS